MNIMPDVDVDHTILARIPEVFAPWDEHLNLPFDGDFEDLEDIEEVEELTF